MVCRRRCWSPGPVSAVVAQAQRNLAAPRWFSIPRVTDCAGGETVLSLPPVEFAAYAWLARRTLAGQPVKSRNRISAADTAEFLAEYRALHCEWDQEMDRVEQALRPGMDTRYFDNRLTKIHRR